MIALSYIVPITLLLFALFTFHVERARFIVDPSSVLVVLWLMAFSLHGAAHSFELAPLYSSSFIANMLLTFAILAFSISFRFSKRLFTSIRGKTRITKRSTAYNRALSRLPEPKRTTKRDIAILTYAILVLYLMYTQAQTIVGSSDVFGQLQLLRTRINYEQAEWGAIEYAALSALVFAVYLGARSSGESVKGAPIAFLALAVVISIAIISSQRTAVLMIIVGFFFARSASGLPSIRVIILSVVGFFSLFVFVGTLVGKVDSTDGDFARILGGGFQSFALYFLTPLSAFSSSEIWAGGAGETQFITRIFLRILEFAGLYAGEIQSLVLGYAFVPMPTNVYTFAHAAISDFGYGYFIYFSVIGITYGFAFSFSRNSSINRAIQGFLYYPILMSVFQDQWMTIASQWIQIFALIFIVHQLYDKRGRLIPRAQHVRNVSVYRASTTASR